MEIAADLRRRSGQRGPAFSTQRIIEDCFPDVFVTGGNLPPNVDEMISRRPEGPIIVYKRSLPILEQRFAIAHALAHLLFDDGRVSARPGRPGIACVERRADLFAAELLVPLSELRPYVGLLPSSDPEDHEIYLDQVDQVASHFMVTAQLIDSRIRELGSGD